MEQHSYKAGMTPAQEIYSNGNAGLWAHNNIGDRWMAMSEHTRMGYRYSSIELTQIQIESSKVRACQCPVPLPLPTGNRDYK
jgi:hypothetical protein